MPRRSPGAGAPPRPGDLRSAKVGGGPGQPLRRAPGCTIDRLTELQREQLRGRRRTALRRRRLTVLGGLTAFVVALVAAVTSSGAPAPRLGSGATLSGTPRPAAAAVPAAHLVLPPRRVVKVPGAAPKIAWPATGQAAAGVLGLGVMASSAAEQPRAIASMTKMMTALVVTRDHPLMAGAAGPLLTMTPADVATYVYDSSHGDSNVVVQLGERLSERQVLEGLLIPSSDNLARTLAVWDAGSVQAFVAKMNADARRLGLAHTHYGDPAGLSAASRSTASDQVVVAEALMSNPALRSIVALSHVAFPVAGTIWNYNPALGVDGIVGVKSGFTQLAQGCLAVAAPVEVAGRQVYVLAVSMHQPDGLAGAAQADEQVLLAAEAQLHPYRVVRPGAEVARVVLPWAGRAPRAVAPAGLVVPAWGGMRLAEQVVGGPLLHPGVPAGALAGELVVGAPSESLPGAAGGSDATGAPATLAGSLAAVPLRLTGPVLSASAAAGSPGA